MRPHDCGLSFVYTNTKKQNNNTINKLIISCINKQYIFFVYGLEVKRVRSYVVYTPNGKQAFRIR